MDVHIPFCIFHSHWKMKITVCTRTSDAASTDTIEKLMTLLRNRYSGARQSDKCRVEVRLRRRRPGESLSSLHQGIRRLMALAYPTLQPDARESVACDHYIYALDDADFGRRCANGLRH